MIINPTPRILHLSCKSRTKQKKEKPLKNLSKSLMAQGQIGSDYCLRSNSSNFSLRGLPQLSRVMVFSRLTTTILLLVAVRTLVRVSSSVAQLLLAFCTSTLSVPVGMCSFPRTSNTGTMSVLSQSGSQSRQLLVVASRI